MRALLALLVLACLVSQHGAEGGRGMGRKKPDAGAKKSAKKGEKAADTQQKPKQAEKKKAPTKAEEGKDADTKAAKQQQQQKPKEKQAQKPAATEQVKPKKTATAPSLVDFKAYPLMQSSDAGPILSPEASEALQNTEGALHLVGFVEIDTLPLMAMHYAHERAAASKAETGLPASAFEQGDSWLIPAGVDEATQRRLVILALRQPDAVESLTNATRAALNVIMTSSAHVVLSVPREDVPVVEPLISSLVVQTEHTHRRVHRPEICLQQQGPCNATGALRPADTTNAPRLPPVSVAVTGLGVQHGATAESLLKRSLAPGGLSLFEATSVTTLPLLLSGDTAAGDAVAATLSLNSRAQELTQGFFKAHLPQAAPAEVPLWVQSGAIFAEWARYVVGSAAPFHAPRKSEQFLASLKQSAVDRAVAVYRHEVGGAVLRGWAIQQSGESVRSLPSTAEAEAAEVESARGVVSVKLNLDSIALRPPSPEELSLLHGAALKRAVLFIEDFVTPAADPSDAITACRAKVAKEMKIFTEVNTRNITAYIRSYSGQLQHIYADKVKQFLRDRVPFKKAVAEAQYSKQAEQVGVDLKAVIGSLWGTEHARSALDVMKGALRDVVSAVSELNDNEVAEALRAAKEGAQRLVEREEVAFPLPEAELQERLASIARAGKLSFEGHVKKFLGNAEGKGKSASPLQAYVWPERLKEAEAAARELDDVITRVSQEARRGNINEVKKSFEAKVAMLTAEFTARVVKGNEIKFPGDENRIFTSAAAEAEKLITSFKSSQGKFQSYKELYDAQLNGLIDVLQDLICGASGNTVTSRNVQALLFEKWARDASVEVERNHAGNPEKYGPALGRHVQESFAKHGKSQWQDLSEGSKKRMVSAWCHMSHSTECPGNCYAWVTNPAIHALDVLGLCETDWVLCNQPPRAAAHGDVWKVGGHIRRCPRPEEKPCPTFWDRRGYPFVKSILRAAYIVMIPLALLGMYRARASMNAKLEKYTSATSPGSRQKRDKRRSPLAA